MRLAATVALLLLVTLRAPVVLLLDRRHGELEGWI